MTLWARKADSMSTIDGKVVQAPAGILGFDTTEVLNAVSAKNYYNKGYRFCVRYVGRSSGKTRIMRASCKANSPSIQRERYAGMCDSFRSRMYKNRLSCSG